MKKVVKLVVGWMSVWKGGSKIGGMNLAAKNNHIFNNFVRLTINPCNNLFYILSEKHSASRKSISRVECLPMDSYTEDYILMQGLQLV